MPRHAYITPFRGSYRFNCNYHFESYSIDEAIASAVTQSLDATILVDADCVIWGKPAVAKVGISVWRLKDQSRENIFALFDAEIDGFIAYRSRFQYWQPGKEKG